MVADRQVYNPHNYKIIYEEGCYLLGTTLQLYFVHIVNRVLTIYVESTIQIICNCTYLVNYHQVTFLHLFIKVLSCLSVSVLGVKYEIDEEPFCCLLYYCKTALFSQFLLMRLYFVSEHKVSAA